MAQRRHAHRNTTTFNFRRRDWPLLPASLSSVYTRRAAADLKWREMRCGGRINDRIAWRGALEVVRRSSGDLLSAAWRHPAAERLSIEHRTGQRCRDAGYKHFSRLSSTAATRLHLYLHGLICCLHLCLINSARQATPIYTPLFLIHSSSRLE